jgi:predicted DNA-binding transcriptional regulator AlpA
MKYHTKDLGRLLRLPEALNFLRIGRTAFYDSVRRQILPPPVRISKRTVAWWEGQLMQAIAHPKGWAGVVAESAERERSTQPRPRA